MVVASEGGWEARASFPGEGPTANVYPWFKVSTSGNNKAMGMVTVDVEENKSSVALDGSVEISLEDKKDRCQCIRLENRSLLLKGAKW